MAVSFSEGWENMALFQKAKPGNAYLKCGIYGQEGTGKTTTACMLAIGLRKLCKERGLPEGDAPVFFADTETGSDWQIERFKKAGVPLLVSKTRAFKQLVPMIREAEKTHAILIIDSLSHFWKELIDTYLAKHGRTRIMPHEWAFLKGPKGTGGYNVAFVNSQVHIIWCARQAWVFSSWEDESGAKQMEATGHKARAEGDASYEPSLLLHMRCDTKQIDPDNESFIIAASVRKDRSDTIQGKTIDLASSTPGGGMKVLVPVMDAFGSHIKYLALGGHQEAVTPGDSGDVIPPDTNLSEREVVLDEIKQKLLEHFPSRKEQDLEEKRNWIKYCFGVNSWSRLEHALSMASLVRGRNKLFKELDGEEYKLPDGVPEDLGLTTGDKIAQPKKKKAARKKKVAK